MASFQLSKRRVSFHAHSAAIAIGINWEGRRSILAVELTSRESTSSWKELLLGLRKRSLGGVEFVVSDDHAGLRKAIQEILPEAVWPSQIRSPTRAVRGANRSLLTSRLYDPRS